MAKNLSFPGFPGNCYRVISIGHVVTSVDSIHVIRPVFDTLRVQMGVYSIDACWRSKLGQETHSGYLTLPGKPALVANFQY